MAHEAPKNHCYSISESTDYRLASAVCTKNEGETHILKVYEQLYLSPGTHTERFVANIDRTRKLRKIKSKLLSTESRRDLLIQMKEVERKSTEKPKVIKYKSNCGMDTNTETPDFMDPQLLANKFPSISVTSDNCDNVYFDQETSGFTKKF